MDDSCSNESSEDEETEFLFMGIKTENLEEESEEVVDLEAELIISLEELRRYKRMYKQLKNKVIEVEEKKNDT